MNRDYPKRRLFLLLLNVGDAAITGWSVLPTGIGACSFSTC